MAKKPKLLLILLLVLAAAACGDDAGETTSTAAVTTTATLGEAALTITGSVTGSVTAEQVFGIDALRDLEGVSLTLEHPKNGPTEYTGVRLKALLDLAGIDATATTVTLIASDGYSIDIPLTDVRACADCLVAFVGEGSLSMAMPGMGSAAWVKDVVEIAAG